MENPATWSPATKVIAEAIEKHAKDEARGVIGLSLPQTIFNALNAKGLLGNGLPAPVNSGNPLEWHNHSIYDGKTHHDCPGCR